MIDGGEEKQVAVPVVQPLAELRSGARKGIDEHRFHQPGLVYRAARAVIWARGELHHPVEDLELGKVAQPGRKVSARR